MSIAQIFNVTIYEDSGACFLARIVAPDGSNATQSDFSGITYTIIDRNDEGTVAASGSLTVSSVVYDTIQSDARWNIDSAGYNFRWDAPAGLFPTGNTIYRVKIIFDPASGEDFPLLYDAHALDLLGQ